MPTTSSFKSSSEVVVETTGPVARIALALTDWTERWVPDAFVFALIATVVVVRRRRR